LLSVADQFGARIVEFTVAPYIATGEGQSYHEWFVEFEQTPSDLDGFATAVDNALRNKNVYYDDLIAGSILQRLQMNVMKPQGFINFMKSVGKLGGQNKVPRLSNDRKIADQLAPFVLQSNRQAAV
jgi:hypothetical protein